PNLTNPSDLSIKNGAGTGSYAHVTSNRPMSCRDSTFLKISSARKNWKSIFNSMSRLQFMNHHYLPVFTVYRLQSWTVWSRRMNFTFVLQDWILMITIMKW